jgi:hypothetical protein
MTSGSHNLKNKLPTLSMPVFYWTRYKDASMTPGAWAQCYKTFSVLNLRIFVISKSVCPWQVSAAKSNDSGKTKSLVGSVLEWLWP